MKIIQDICNREFIFAEWCNSLCSRISRIKNPGVFVQTNGTFTLVDVAYKYWMNKPFTYKEKYHISTDEVYGTTPYSPYSASKASSDMIIRAYNETYGLNTVIMDQNNMMKNNYKECSFRKSYSHLWRWEKYKRLGIRSL